MKDLLENSFTTYHNLPVCSAASSIQTTSLPYFEIEDDANKELQIHSSQGIGMAKFNNVGSFTFTIVNYDKFVTSLPRAFQQGRKRCDLLISCDRNEYFVVGELKDRIYSTRVRDKAFKQILDSLIALTPVPEISRYINSKTVKRCCYFNKQSVAPGSINATNAFNRLNTTFSDGFKMSNPQIEAYGFEFYEYTGNQVMTLA